MRNATKGLSVFNTRSCWVEGVVPVAVPVVAVQCAGVFEGFHLLVGDLDTGGVVGGVEFGLPGAGAVAVGAAAAGGDQQLRRVRVGALAGGGPQGPDGVDGECRGIVVGSNTDPTGVGGQVVDALRVGLDNGGPAHLRLLDASIMARRSSIVDASGQYPTRRSGRTV